MPRAREHHTMSAYYLGIDIGATKSHALIADETGRVVGLGQAGPGKRQGDDFSRVSRVLNAITDQALAMAGLVKGQMAGAGFGISDYDWPSQRAPHLREIETLNLEVPIELVNDSVIGLLAGASQGWGVGLIAGTGCNCWGLAPDRRVGHVTGFGLRFGEAAGANELVARAIQVVADAWRLSGLPTRLTEVFCDLVNASDADDLIEGLTLNRYHILPSAAPLVFRAAEEGDTVAVETIAWAGRGLARLAEAVIRQLGFEHDTFEVILAGSMFKGGPLLINPLRDTLHEVAPGAQLVDLDAPPVIGGVVLGMEQAGMTQAAIQRARTHMLATVGEVMAND
jgi:N-acetylglucosamine kinase-like BadF-type ATPase